MDDKDETDRANVARLHDTGARKRSYLKTLRLFKDKIDQGVAFGATTSIRIYKFVKPRVGWKQRLRIWLKGD